jgi:hypothetical protein
MSINKIQIKRKYKHQTKQNEISGRGTLECKRGTKYVFAVEILNVCFLFIHYLFIYLLNYLIN